MLKLPETPRTIEGIDIAHLQGTETVASLVQFLDGLPFKPGYKRFRIRLVDGVDDSASIREVVGRRFKRLHDEEGVFPDILLIDGGLGQPMRAGRLLLPGDSAADGPFVGQLRGGGLWPGATRDPPQPDPRPGDCCNTPATRPTGRAALPSYPARKSTLGSERAGSGPGGKSAVKRAVLRWRRLTASGQRRRDRGHRAAEGDRDLDGVFDWPGRPTRGMQSRSHWGSGSVRFTVGGANPSRSREGRHC